MIQIEVGGRVAISGCPPHVIKACAKALTIPNPAYFRVVRITGSRFTAQQNFKYYKVSKDFKNLIIPRGFLNRFIAYLDKTQERYNIVWNVVKKEANTFTVKHPEMRDYQKQIVDSMVQSANGGVVVAGTGSGKTVMTLESIRRQKKTSLILVPNTVIQKQFVDTATNMFGYNIGIINAQEKRIENITVSTWQSLMADEELITWLKDDVSHIYIDECHQVISDRRQEILAKFHPEKIYGLTGSPRRSKDDGRTQAIFFILGPIIHEYAVTQLSPKVKVFNTNAKVPVLDYNEMIDILIADEQRNKLIIGTAMLEVLAKKKVLILTKRIEHAKKLFDLIQPEINDVYLIESQDKNRNQLLSDLSDENIYFNIILGTLSLLGTGLDIPALDTLIFAESIKSDVLVQQGVGRILRLFEGKTEPIIYDLCDEKNPIFMNQYKERLSFYRRMHWQVKEMGWVKT